MPYDIFYITSGTEHNKTASMIGEERRLLVFYEKERDDSMHIDLPLGLIIIMD